MLPLEGRKKELMKMKLSFALENLRETDNEIYLFIHKSKEKCKIFAYLLFAIISSIPFGLRAQETLTVGDGTDINYRVPYYCYWGSMMQHSQIVYNESMLSSLEGYEITGLTFYVNQGTSDIGNVAVTLGQTTSSAMNGQWFPMTNSDVVYDGEVAIEESLLTITFTTPYAYNGGNLVVDLNYYTCVNNTSTVTWLGVNDASMGDISAADMYFEGTPQKTYTFLPKTTFTYSESSCLPAYNLAITSLDSTHVTLFWSASPTALSYNVTVGDSTYNTSDLSITINSLQPDSIYTVSLQAVCEDNALSQARTLTFRTPIAPAEVPYSTGFEAEDDVAWQTLNDTSAWYIGNATGDNSSNSLYISADGGVSLGCSLLDHNDAYAYRTFHLTSAGQYRLDYRWRVNADVYYDYGRAYIAPAGTVVEAGTQPGTNSAMSFTPDGWINAGSLPLRNETSWHSDSCIFNITSSDTLITLIFLWHNEPYGNGTSSIAIDNISLVKLLCPTITSLNLESTTASTATFSWDNTHYIYELEARIGDSVHASATVYDETSATLTGLSIDNDYEVYLRGVCDAANDEYTAWYGPVITHIGYCQPTPDNVDGQGIVEVSYGTALVATNTDHPTSAPYYASYHNVVGVALPGDTLPIDITYSTRFVTGQVSDYGTIIWIDWNQNIEFESNEVVYVGESDIIDPSVLHASIVISPNTPVGFYRMRIAGASTGFDSYINTIADAANADPCFSFSWAVAHDYTLHINTTNKIDLQVDSMLHGTVTGAGNFVHGQSITISATPYNGYHFTHWNDGDINNPRSFILTQDTSFIAMFAKNQYTITGSPSDTTYGVVTGSGIVDYLDTVTLMATAKYGYFFQRWNDNNVENPRKVAATANVSMTAYFDYNQYTITLAPDTTIHGTVIGSGTYNYLSERTISATANYGYHFTQWSDGITDNPRTLTLTQDTTFTAMFEPNQYAVTGVPSFDVYGMVSGSDTVDYMDTVTLMATPNYGYQFQYWYRDGYYGSVQTNPMQVVASGNIYYTAYFTPMVYTVGTQAEHGSVYIDGSRQYQTQVSLTVTANYGYRFTQWSDGVTDNPRTFTITQDTSFTALFEHNEYTLAFQSADTTKGVVTVVSVSGLYLDTTPYVTATALPHYHFTQWNDGSTENPRRFVFDGDHTYTASFAIDVHTVGVQVDNLAHGTVSGAGSREYGQPITVSATAYSGYQFTHWSDGSTYNPYTFAVLEDKDLTAIFVADGEPWQDTVVLYDTAYVLLHDTTYLNVMVHDTTVVRDTTYIDVPYAVHDTTYITLTDTVTNTVYDTVDNYIYDTVTVTDTLWLTRTDTLWLHDTVTVHDTVYVTGEGIDGAEALNAKVYSSHGQVVVEGAEGNTVALYDVNGRLLATKQDDYGTALHFDVTASGTYMIKIGHYPARKVVVIR